MRDPDAKPTVSKTLDDGTLVELLYDPNSLTTSLAVARPDGLVSVETLLELPSGERLVPYSAHNNLIATACVLLPSAVGDIGAKSDLIEEVRAFLHRYVDLSPRFEEIAAHYVLLTWVYDAFNELPYLRFRGEFGTGKTRALLALGSLCYKPFFASGASTVSPIFHVLEAFGGTLILDEADFRFSDATAELTKILNNGNVAGLPVLRTMANRHRELNPQAFRVFGPKLIGMREHFSDRALESRFLTEETGGRELRADIPIHLPAEMKDEARMLRNKLLAWRFQNRFAVAPDPSRLPSGLSPRASQTALALLSVVDDEGLRARICASLMEDDVRLREERRLSLDGVMLSAILAAFEGGKAGGAPISAITAAFNERAEGELGHAMSNRWVGAFVRGRLRLKTVKSRGVYAVPAEERSRVLSLAHRYGLSPLSPEQTDESFAICTKRTLREPAMNGDDGEVAPP